MIENVTIIGSGNVATHYAKRLAEKKINIDQVYSRDNTKAETLAFEVDAQPITDLNLITANSDLYIVAVSDDVIEEIFQTIDKRFEGSIIAHTSGSAPLVAGLQNNTSAVFYPLQTFSKDRYANFKKIPILVEAETKKASKALLNLGEHIANTCQIISEEQRMQLHLAAVFINNFTNHLFEVSESILKEKGLDFSLLSPLLHETIKKVEQLGPHQSQTGPALRNDKTTIARHLAMLEGEEKLKEMYTCFTENIQKLHHA